MSCNVCLNANTRVQKALQGFVPLEDLKGLGNQATHKIEAELRKASLGSIDHIEDVLQDTLLAMYALCERGYEIENFRSYFLAVARNLARRHMQQIIRLERHREAMLKVVEGEVYLPEEPLQDERRLVLDALSRLRDTHRNILEMMLIDNLSDDEIRLKLGKSGETCAFRVAKHRALRALRDALRQGEQSEGKNRQLERSSHHLKTGSGKP